ncbi:hypothetical protein DN069_35145 [Streptacidiphilus pinicola]|uniref:HTH araC/xylS-type domain-containing protein n=1 Tax=Streptacidiphilus pinicola TaxID=2219663 RepID=A0A2X0ITQ4_9ACTN|nr:helix-turn-helix domain-containing protein [Streptacidiphilus pinicola]RAG80956.1 hypothetical protein DN069_35145 [Streptacidiphilus pinicola]
MTLSSADDDPLREVITMLSRELVRTEPAQQLVLDRLLDLLLVLTIRSEFRRSTTAPRWYRAAADPRLGDLRADDLTLPQVADAVGYSSPFAFAAAFRRHHGEPPGAWRQGERAAADTRLLTTHAGT